MFERRELALALPGLGRGQLRLVDRPALGQHSRGHRLPKPCVMNNLYPGVQYLLYALSKGLFSNQLTFSTYILVSLVNHICIYVGPNFTIVYCTYFLRELIFNDQKCLPGHRSGNRLVLLEEFLPVRHGEHCGVHRLHLGGNACQFKSDLYFLTLLVTDFA